MVIFNQVMFPKVDIKDYESNKKLNSVRAFFLPSRTELAMYLLLAIVATVILNIETIWSLATGTPDDFSTSAKSAISNQVSTYNTFLRSDLLGRATGFVVWGFIGSIAYMGVWIVQHFFLRVKMDVQEEGFAHQSEQGRTYWESKVAQTVLAFAAVMTFIVVVFSLSYFAPVIASLGNACLKHPMEVSSYAFLGLGLLLAVVYQYVFVRSWRIVKYAFTMYFDGTEE